MITDDQAAFPEAFPYLAQIPVELRAMNYDYKQEFEFGLDLILDGIERMRDGESSSAKK